MATDTMAEKAIPMITQHLSRVVKNPDNLESRTAMSWADTLAGILILNSGTTLPHAIGQPISGKFPQIRHGQTLAAVYPAFMEFSWKGKPKRFAQLAEWLGEQVEGISEEKAAQKSVPALNDFLDRIHLRINLTHLGLGNEDIQSFVDSGVNCPDVYTNPVVASRDEIIMLYEKSF